MTELTETGATIKVKINKESYEIELLEDKDEDKEEPNASNVAEATEHYNIINDSRNDSDDSDVVKVVIKKDNESEEDSSPEDDKVKEVIEHICGKCFKSYSNVNRLQRHLKFCRTQTKIDNSKIQNEVIKEMEENLEKIEKEAINMEEKNICFCCKENFETSHSGHIRCYECTKSFKNAKSFERHVFLIHSGIEKFPCDICNARCPTAGILELHRRSHSRGKPFACKKCGKEFTRRYHLFRHQEYSTCDNVKPKGEILCKVCGKIFYRVDNLRTHLRQHVRETPKNRDYQCPYCEKSFYGTATLNIHIRSHTGERPFPCDLCDKNFPSNAALRKHRRSHTGEKPYICVQCKKSFAAKEVLNRHMKIHTGERPHSCDTCGKSFIQATQLRNHLRLHHRSEPFKCTFCNKEFSVNKLFKKHMKENHNGEDVNHCDQCEASFRTPGGLNRHISRIHKKSNFVCCDLKFSTKTEYDSHMSARHGVKTKQKLSSSKNEKKIEYIVKTVDLGIIKTEEEEEAEEENLDSNVKIEEYILEDINEETEQQVVDEEDQLLKKEILEKIENSDNAKDTNCCPFESEENEDAHSLMEIDDADNADDDDDEIVLVMDEESLKKNIEKLLGILLDKDILVNFGWPTADVEIVLQKVIRNCGHTPNILSNIKDTSTRLREYVKLLFNVVIDNDIIKELLNNHSVDEVIYQVLKMANVN